MKYTCILFDLDQTLILRTPTIPQKLHEVMEKLGISHTAAQVDKAFADCEYWIGEQTTLENQTGIRMSDEVFLAKLTELYQQALSIPDDGVPALQTVLCRQHASTYTLMPGAEAVLSALRKAGFTLGIVSNNYSSVRSTLVSLALPPYFDCIVISEEVGLQKPDPAIIHLACSQCGVKSENVLYVGDHPFDITCAHAAGVAVAWLPPNRWFRLPNGSKEPEYVFQALTDLPGVLNA